MVRESIRRAATLVASLSLVFAAVIPLHAHTCHWPSAPSGAAAVEPLSPDAGTATGHEGPCPACTLDRRLQTLVTVGPGRSTRSPPPPTALSPPSPTGRCAARVG